MLNKGYRYYQNGQYEDAVYWYRKAAEQGYARAQYNLGAMHGNGQGVKKNRTTAKEWYKKACSGGYKDACRYM